MVLEKLFPDDWLEKKFRYAFALGFGYSILGIIIAKFLFPANSGIVSVIFVSVFSSPFLRKVFFLEEKDEEKIAKFSWKYLWKLHYDVVLMYFLVFLGIFFAYLAFSFVLPQFGISAFDIIKEQLFLDRNLKGSAAFSVDTLFNIVYNNWWVLVSTFILALIAGDGAVFFVAWNASAWGAIFGARALLAASYSGVSSWIVLIKLLSVVVWHVALEGGAYIFVGIAGSIISNEIIQERLEVRQFGVWFIGSCLSLGAIYYVLEAFSAAPLARLLAYFTFFIASMRFLGRIVAVKKNAQIFTFNINLFSIAFLIFIIGAIIEVYVLNNSTTLSTINRLFYCSSSNIPIGVCV